MASRFNSVSGGGIKTAANLPGLAAEVRRIVGGGAETLHPQYPGATLRAELGAIPTLRPSLTLWGGEYVWSVPHANYLTATISLRLSVPAGAYGLAISGSTLSITISGDASVVMSTYYENSFLQACSGSETGIIELPLDRTKMAAGSELLVAVELRARGNGVARCGALTLNWLS